MLNFVITRRLSIFFDAAATQQRMAEVEEARQLQERGLLDLVHCYWHDFRTGPASCDAESFEYKRRTYYFCSQECKDNFDKNPHKYLDRMRQPEHHH